MKEVKHHVLEIQKKCCFSVYTLKSLISIGTVVTLLIGIALLYVLVYAFVVSSVTAQIQSTFRNVFIGSFLASSMFMIFSSLAGIYGLIRKKNKLLVFYAVTMVLYFASFIVLGIFLASYPNSLAQQCDSPTQNDFQLAVNQANKTLCKGECECYFPSIDNYTPQQKKILNNMGIQSSLNQSFPVNAQNCQKWKNETYIQTQQLIMIQSFFECAGWCNVDSNFNLYYLFTNVNKGIPTNGCIQAIIQFFDDFGLILEVSSFIVSGILFVILVHIICLCWHPQRSNQYDALKFFKDTLVVSQNSDEDMTFQQTIQTNKNG